MLYMQKVFKIFEKGIIYELLFVLIVVGILFAYLYDNNTDEVKLKIGNEKYVFSKNDTDFDVDLTTLNAEFDTIIENENNLEKIKINGERLYFKKNIGIVEISETNKIKLEIKFKGDSKYTEYTINTFPQTMPKFTCTGESHTDGDFYFTTYGASDGLTNSGAEIFLLKLNNNGKIKFYRKTHYKSYLFKKHIIDTEIYYTYLDADINGKINIYVLDEKYNLIKVIDDKVLSIDNILIDFHDYMIIDLNNYIISYYNSDGSETVSEIKNGKVVWTHTWPTCKFLDIDYSNNLTLIERERHFNSFELDNDDNLLISFRHSNEIVKVERKTGNIIWTLGGENNDFDLTIFSRQHAITRVNDTYIVFNNNNKSISNVFANVNVDSSVVVFNLDQKNMKVKNVKSYNLGCLSYELGSAWPSEIENDIYVVDYGRSMNKGKKGFQEINLETGEVYFTFEYPDDTAFVYRTYKY